MLHTIQSIPWETFLTMLLGGLAVNFAPGQDIFFASACGIAGGPRMGAIAGLGVGVGVLWHVALAALGLAAVIAAHPGALTAIKYVGAGYLLWLAWKSWRAGSADGEGRAAPDARRAFLRGILSNVTNPKPVLFMLAFLPQFVDPAIGPVWQQVTFFGLVFGFTGGLVTAGFGYLAGLAGRAIGAHMGAVNKIAAVLFAGLAVRLVLSE